MNTNVLFKNYSGDKNIKEEIALKLEKFDKYFTKTPDAFIVFNEIKEITEIEITLHILNSYLRVEANDLDPFKAMDKALDKLKNKINKFKGKLNYIHNESIKYEEIDDDEKSDEKTFVKSKKFNVKPMSKEEAALQMELLGHSFFVFLNDSSEEFNVIYKRKDGHYGLIEPE